MNIAGRGHKRNSTAGEKPRIPESHSGLGCSQLIITGQGADKILLMHFYKYAHLCFLFEVMGMDLKAFYILGNILPLGHISHTWGIHISPVSL